MTPEQYKRDLEDRRDKARRIQEAQVQAEEKAKRAAAEKLRLGKVKRADEWKATLAKWNRDSTSHAEEIGQAILKLTLPYETKDRIVLPLKLHQRSANNDGGVLG